MFAATNSCALLGTSAIPVRVEANLLSGLPRFTIIGMREADAREACERIRCGLLAVGVKLPPMRVTVNLAPADLPKAGAAFDLPITVAILAAMEQLPVDSIDKHGFLGEVGLDGCLRPVLGGMAAALGASRAGWRSFVMHEEGAGRAAHASIRVHGATRLRNVIDHLRGIAPLVEVSPDESGDGGIEYELSDVRGQETAVQSLLIAAAGGHNMLMFGAPGCGKTMLANRLPGLLPDLTGEEGLEVATIHDAAGISSRGVGRRRPFRAPHHNVMTAALVGGGSTRPTVGEVTLAHLGILFLDELPEFRPSAIDALRQPIEQGRVVVRRAGWTVSYPARTQLIAAMNLCKCGRRGARDGKTCTCSPTSRQAYLQRVSGAILDRIDLHIPLHKPDGSILGLAPAPTTSEARAIVTDVWERQDRRWGPSQRNARVDLPADSPLWSLESAAADRLDALAIRSAVSARTQGSVLRVARTIADLRGDDHIRRSDISQSFMLSDRAAILGVEVR